MKLKNTKPFSKHLVISMLIIASLFIASVSIFFPGSYANDTWYMYLQAIQHDINDWHSPIVTYTWGKLLFLTHKYYSLYILQLLFYWIFVFLLLTVLNKSIKVFVFGLLAAAFLVFIPQYVIKDVHMVVPWSMAVCLLLFAGDKCSRYSRGLTIVAFLFLAYGFFSRINMIVATLPLAYIVADLLFNKIRKTFLKALIAVSICAGLVAANQLLNKHVFKASKAYAQYKLKLLDIAGISLTTGHNYFPACITSYKDFSMQAVESAYSPASFDDVYWPANFSTPVPMPDSVINDQTDIAWKRAIKEHPFIYFKNRAKGFLYYLRIKKRFEDNQYWNVAISIYQDNPLKVSRDNNVFIDFFNALYASLAGTCFFSPWFWLVLNSVLFIYFLIKYRSNSLRKDLKIQALIQLSGVLGILSQFPIFQHDRDFRYSYWNVMVFFIGCVCAAQKQKSMGGPSHKKEAVKATSAQV